MRTAWHAAFGAARGPAARLVPRARLATGALLLGACLAAPVASLPGALLAALACGAWVAACRPPAALALRLAAAAAVLTAPYALLAPWLAPGPAPLGRLAVPGTILARAVAGLLVSGSTAAVLCAGELREAVLGLPLPRAVAEIVLQIVQQAGSLASEVKRIGDAMAVRGATGRGAAPLLAVTALPRAWLPRVLDRAERVALALELRGYLDPAAEPAPAPLRAADAAALLAGAAALAAAVALRWAP